MRENNAEQLSDYYICGLFVANLTCQPACAVLHSHRSSECCAKWACSTAHTPLTTANITHMHFLMIQKVFQPDE